MTKHKPDCKRVFKNYDKTCPRCIELMNGAKARKGWQADYFKRKKENEIRQSKEIKNHDCKKSGCMSICTFGDW